MTKILYYVISMVAIILVLPLLIVGGFVKSDFNRDFSIKAVPAEKDDIVINVYMTDTGEVVQMELEEYLQGVVAAEMPAEFELEALKAQAVASRTYAYYRIVNSNIDKSHAGANVCTDFTHCQAWKCLDEAVLKWDKNKALKNMDKIKKAVTDTRNIIIKYEGEVIDPVFHSNSGGRTENSRDVWDGGEFPYLKSVISQGEDKSPAYENTIVITPDDFVATLQDEFPELEVDKDDLKNELSIIDYTEGQRVKTLRVGNIKISGVDFRKIFELKSANFEFEMPEDNIIKITAYGNGHGVGMSQWGANHLAQTGSGYEKILKHYYQNVELSTIP